MIFIVLRGGGVERVKAKNGLNVRCETAAKVGGGLCLSAMNCVVFHSGYGLRKYTLDHYTYLISGKW